MSFLYQLLSKGISEKVFPGASAIVIKGKEIISKEAIGYTSDEKKEQVTQDTLFDIASITKVFTAMLILKLMLKGVIEIDAPLKKYGEDFSYRGKGEIQIANLLSHTAGFSSWEPYYRLMPSSFIGKKKAKEFILNSIISQPLEYPPGKKELYSDLGFILLGIIVERVLNMRLEDIMKEEIFDKLNLQSTFFVPLDKPEVRKWLISKYSFAATEFCPWRKRILKAEVHDENSFALGGVSGHAGIFSTASDLAKFGMWILKEAKIELGSKLFLRVITPSSKGTRTLGWDTPLSKGSSAGKYISKRSIGHLGFTGCSLWIDLEKECIIVLLTNRVHPKRSNEKIRAFRPYFHNEVLKRLEIQKDLKSYHRI